MSLLRSQKVPPALRLSNPASPGRPSYREVVTGLSIYLRQTQPVLEAAGTDRDTLDSPHPTLVGEDDVENTAGSC